MAKCSNLLTGLSIDLIRSDDIPETVITDVEAIKLQ